MSDGGHAERITEELKLSINKLLFKVEGNTVELERSIDRSDAGSYSRAISRIAVAQICETIGFEGFKDSALDSLADIAVRYIRDLSKISKFYANLAGRTECNVFDVAQGLQDLGSSHELSGASASMTEIKYYIERSHEVPFAQPIQQFPVVRDLKMKPSFSQIDESPSFKHIPSWVCAFPDPHTYIHTPIWNERVSDARADRIELARQHRKAERSLLSLQQRLLLYNKPPSMADGASSGLDVGEAEEKHTSLVEAFGPAVESMGGGLDSGSDGERMVPPRTAEGVALLEFKRGKKVFGEPLDLRVRNKVDSWFGREDERDDKKRRVEFMLRQSLENQHELSQL